MRTTLTRLGGGAGSVADAVARVRDEELTRTAAETLIRCAGQCVEQVSPHDAIVGKLHQMLVGQIGGSVQEPLVDGAEDLVSLAVLSPRRRGAVLRG